MLEIEFLLLESWIWKSEGRKGNLLLSLSRQYFSKPALILGFQYEYCFSNNFNQLLNSSRDLHINLSKSNEKDIHPDTSRKPSPNEVHIHQPMITGYVNASGNFYTNEPSIRPTFVQHEPLTLGHPDLLSLTLHGLMGGMLSVWTEYWSCLPSVPSS